MPQQMQKKIAPPMIYNIIPSRLKVASSDIAAVSSSNSSAFSGNASPSPPILEVVGGSIFKFSVVGVDVP